MTDWQAVVVPQGRYMSWGSKPPQVVIGKFVSYDENGGEDFNGKTCPELVLELTEDAVSYKEKEGSQETISAGDMTTITCGLYNLNRGVRRAAPDFMPGRLVRITMTGTAKTNTGNTVKEFLFEHGPRVKPQETTFDENEDPF